MQILRRLAAATVRCIVALMLVIATAAVSHAVNYTWDASGGDPTEDGSGTWSPTGGTNWFDGTTYGAWGNTTSDIAFFGVGSGAAGTVMVSGSVATNGIAFNNAGSGNYTLTGGTLGFGGTTPTITVNATGTSSIGSLLSGATLTKSGAGTLALSGSGSTFTGALTQTAGGIINTGSFNSGGLLITGGSFLNQNRLRQTAGVFEVNGPSASFDNTGVIIGASGNLLIRNGSMTNSGTITGFAGGAVFGVGTGSGVIDTSQSAPATFTNLASGSMQVGGGNIGREYWGTLTNAGYLAMPGANIGRAVSGTSLGVTVAGTSAVTITSGTIDSTGANILMRLNGTNFSNSAAQMNLNGGVWTTSSPTITTDITGNTGTNNRFEVNFNGGTFRTFNNAGVTMMPTSLTAVTLNAGGGTLDIGGSGTTTNIIAASIGGVGALTKTGIGTLSLTGSNSFSGSTRLVAGSLSLSNTNALRNSTLELLDGDTGTVSAIGQNSTLGGLSGSRNLDMLTRTLSIGNNNTSTAYSGQLSNGLLVKIGTGTLSLTGSNPLTGTTAINGGVLSLGNAGALGSAGSISFGGGTMQFTAANTIDYSSRFLTGQAFNIDTNGQNVVFVSPLTIATGTLRKTGAGDLAVSGSISAGVTGVGAGTLVNTGPGTLTISGTIFKNSQGVTLRADAGSGGFLVSGPIAGTANSVFLDGGGAGTVSGPITTAFAITKSGTGSWILSGSNSFTANTSISAGVLNIRNNAAFGVTSNVATVTAGAALELQGGITVPNALTLNGGGVSDGGGLRNVSGTNTYAGQITQGSASRVNSDAGTLTLDRGPVSSSFLGAFNLSIGGAGDVVVASPISIGVGQLIKDGTGTLRLTGASAYTGTTSVNAGTLQIGNGGTTGALSGSSVITGSSGAMFVFNRTDSYGGNFSNTIGGDLTVRLTTGTLTLAGNNTYTGGTQLASGRLSLGSANAIGSTGTIAFAGGTIQFTASNTTDYSSRFSTAGSQAFNIDTNGQSLTLATGLVGTGNTLQKIGTGTLSLTGSNSVIAGVAINAGVLSLGNVNALGSAGTISFGGGTMQFTASNTTDYSSRFSTANNQAFNFDTNGQNVTLATAFTGTGSTLRKAGTGLLTLSANSSAIAGVVTVESGTLLHSGTLSAGGASVSADSTLHNQGSVTLTGDVFAAASGASVVNSGQFLQSGYRNLVVRSTASLTNSGTMGFGGFFMGGGAGVTTEVATFTNNAGGSFSSGDTSIGGANFATFTNAGGSYTVGSGLSLGRSNGVMTAGTTALMVTSGTVTAGSGGAITITISGTVSNATAEINLNGGLFSAARGITTTLGTGTNNALLVNFGGGTLRGTGANAILLPSSLTAVNLNAGGGTVQINSGVTNTIAAAMSGAGGLAKTGAGVLQLTGENTYAGLTSVDAGTLRVNGLLGVGGVSVASGAILAGSGTIGGPVSILGGGIVGPGNSPGTLTVNDAFSLAGSSILNFELNAADTTVGGGINDLITGVTNLTLGGFLDITGSGDWTTLSPGASWRLFNYSGTLTDNGFAIRTAPVLAAGQSLQISTATANQVNVIVVPEPGALALAGIGAALAGWMTICRRR